MKFINHITLNTGHLRQSYPEEVDKSLYFVLKRILRESQQPAGAVVVEGYRLHTTLESGSAVATIIAENDGMPVLTTAVSRNDAGGLWRKMHETATTPLATHADDPAPVPYIVDRLEFGAMMHLDAMTWTGDFSRCFGWVVLAPQKIR